MSVWAFDERLTWSLSLTASTDGHVVGRWAVREVRAETVHVEYLPMGVACDWRNEQRGHGFTHGFAHVIVVTARDRENGERVESYLCHTCVLALGIRERREECGECRR